MISRRLILDSSQEEQNILQLLNKFGQDKGKVPDFEPTRRPGRRYIFRRILRRGPGTGYFASEFWQAAEATVYFPPNFEVRPGHRVLRE